MFWRGHLPTFFLAIFFLLGCAQPVETPQLPRSNQPAISYVILSDRITPSDIRNIFRALNQKNTLNGLKPWLEDPTDSELEWLAEFISKNFYQESFDPKGLMALLSASTDQKQFSRAEQASREWQASPTAAAEKNLIWNFLSSLYFHKSKTLVQLLSPEMDTFYRGLDSKKDTATSSSNEILADVEKILANTQLRELALKNAPLWKTAIPSLFSGIAETGQTTRSFESLGAALQGKLEEISKLLNLVRLLNQGSDGLFVELNEHLTTKNDDVRSLAQKLEPLISKALARHVIDTLKEREPKEGLDKKFWLAAGASPNVIGPEFKEIFFYVRAGLDSLSSASRAEARGNRILGDVPLYLNAYVLTRWIVQAHTQKSVRDALDKVTTETLTTFWERDFDLAEFKLDLATKEATDFRIVKDLATLTADLQGESKSDAEKTIATIQSQLATGVLTLTVVESPPLKGSLKHALDDVTAQSHRVFPLDDPTPLFVAFVQSLKLDRLETPNMLESTLRASLGPSSETLEDLLSFTLNDLGFRALSSDVRKILLSFVGPKHKQWANEVLLSIPAAEILLQKEDGAPSPFSTLHSLLSGFSPNRAKSLTKIVEFLAALPIGQLDAEGKPVLPAINQWLSEGNQFSSTLRQLASALSQEEARQASATVFAGLCVNLESHWDLAKDLINQSRPGIASFLDRTSLSSIADWAPEQRSWIVRFVEGSEFDKAYAYFSSRGSKTRAREALASVLELTRSGALHDALSLLTRIQSERMKHTAEILTRWENSGELLAFLRMLDVYLSP